MPSQQPEQPTRRRASGEVLRNTAIARLRLADLVGGFDAEPLRAVALAYAAREGVTALAAVTEHPAPGFGCA